MRYRRHIPNKSNLKPRCLQRPESGFPTCSGSFYQHFHRSHTLFHRFTGSILSGEAWIAQVYDAVKSGPQWDRMVFVLNFDEHGGFYDHVAPPTVADDNINPNPGPHPDYTRLGFRVPAVAMGPFAPKKIVSDGPYEHCSVLAMIEWRFGLDPMTARDKNAKNLAEALDFSTSREPFELPAFTAPMAAPCPQPS